MINCTASLHTILEAATVHKQRKIVDKTSLHYTTLNQSQTPAEKFSLCCSNLNNHKRLYLATHCVDWHCLL